MNLGLLRTRCGRRRKSSAALAGANRDGTAGLAAIHDGGGTTFVQSPETALFAQMPASAAASADFQLDPYILGRHLMLLLDELGR